MSSLSNDPPFFPLELTFLLVLYLQFAPPILVTPLGALSVIIGFVALSLFSNEAGAKEERESAELTSSSFVSFRFRAILASFLLDEKLGRLGICGCACCLIGSLIIVLRESRHSLSIRRELEGRKELNRVRLSQAHHLSLIPFLAFPDAPADKEVETVDEIWDDAMQPGSFTHSS